MPACLLVNVGLLGLLAPLPLFSSLWRAFHTVFFKYRTKTMLSFSFTLTRAFMYVQWLPSICYLVLQSWAKLSVCQKQAALPSWRYLWLLGAGFPCSWKERPIFWFIICLSFLCLNERNLCFLWEGQGQWKVVPFLIKRLRTLCQWQSQLWICISPNKHAVHICWRSATYPWPQLLYPEDWKYARHAEYSSCRY